MQNYIDMKESLDRIKGPLNEPANELLFTQLENVIGSKLPDGFKQLYCFSNGFNNSMDLFSGIEILPIEQIIKEYDDNFKITEFSSFKGTLLDVINFRLSNIDSHTWLKFGSYNSNPLLLNLSSSDKSSDKVFFGQVVVFNEQTLELNVLANSIEQLIVKFITIAELNDHLETETAKIKLGKTLLLVSALIINSVYLKFQSYDTLSILSLVCIVPIVWLYLKMKKIKDDKD